MSVTITIISVLPAATTAWPLITSAAMAAAGAFGFTSVQFEKQPVKKAKDHESVEISVENSQAVSEGFAVGEELAFVKGDVNIVFYRNNQGKYGVRAWGKNQSKAKLKAIGEEFAHKITQQYVYHQLVSEFKNRQFNIVEENVEQDGTVKMQVRIFQG